MTAATVRGEAGADRRERILRAALQAFAEKGFDGASTREIATRAGVNHGLIPYYFGAKEKLWQAAVDRAFEKHGEGMQALLDDSEIGDERERARRLIGAHVRFVAAHPELVRLMHDEGRRRGPRMRWIVDRHVKPMYEAINGLLERGRASGSIRADVDPVHFFYVFAGAAGLIFHQAEECRRLSGVDPFDPTVVDAHARVVEEMLLGAISAGSGSAS